MRCPPTRLRVRWAGPVAAGEGTGARDGAAGAGDDEETQSKKGAGQRPGNLLQTVSRMRSALVQCVL